MDFFLKLLRFLFGTPKQPAAVPTAPGKAPASPADPRADPYFSQPAPPPASAATPAKGKVQVKSSPGLEAGAYLPITREEVKEAAKGQNLRANPGSAGAT
jgi:hypothetical protein